MTDQQGSLPVTYRVVGQEQTEELTSAGGFEDVVRITYETPSGHIGYVRIPKRVYTAEAAHDAILADVHEVERVNQLGQLHPASDAFPMPPLGS